MDYRFYIDPETELPHIYNHGVLEEEIRQVFLWPGEEHTEARDSRIRLGRTSAG